MTARQLARRRALIARVAELRDDGPASSDDTEVELEVRRAGANAGAMRVATGRGQFGG